MTYPVSRSPVFGSIPDRMIASMSAGADAACLGSYAATGTCSNAPTGCLHLPLASRLVSPLNRHPAWRRVRLLPSLPERQRWRQRHARDI